MFGFMVEGDKETWPQDTFDLLLDIKAKPWELGVTLLPCDRRVVTLCGFASVNDVHVGDKNPQSSSRL